MAEDRELVERLCHGDRDALRRIYEKYKDDLLTIASCMLADRADAEDCLHDVFVSLVAGSARVQPQGLSGHGGGKPLTRSPPQEGTFSSGG